MISFARRTGQPLKDVLEMHPRDLDTWRVQELQDHLKAKQEAGLAAAHAEHSEQMGR